MLLPYLPLRKFFWRKPYSLSFVTKGENVPFDFSSPIPKLSKKLIFQNSKNGGKKWTRGHKIYSRYLNFQTSVRKFIIRPWNFRKQNPILISFYSRSWNNILRYDSTELEENKAYRIFNESDKDAQTVFIFAIWDFFLISPVFSNSSTA